MKEGILGLNVAEYKYEHAFGIDLMLFNQSSLAFTVDFPDNKYLTLYTIVDSQASGVPVSMSKQK